MESPIARQQEIEESMIAGITPIPIRTGGLSGINAYCPETSAEGRTSAGAEKSMRSRAKQLTRIIAIGKIIRLMIPTSLGSEEPFGMYGSVCC